MRSAVKAVNYRPTRGQAYRGRGVRRERLSGAKVSNSQYVRGIARTPEDQLGGARNGERPAWDDNGSLLRAVVA